MQFNISSKQHRYLCTSLEVWLNRIANSGREQRKKLQCEKPLTTTHNDRMAHRNIWYPNVENMSLILMIWLTMFYYLKSDDALTYPFMLILYPLGDWDVKGRCFLWKHKLSNDETASNKHIQYALKHCYQQSITHVSGNFSATIYSVRVVFMWNQRPNIVDI